MGRVIPDYLSDGRDVSYYAGSAFSSVRLIMGEVQERIEIDNPRNVNKRVPEYSVWCAMYENDTYASRLISNVVPMDTFGSGVADYLDFTYRGANSASVNSSNNQLGYGLGSKVLLLAINGNRNNYVIIGGIRNSKSDPISTGLNHHLDFNFNGIEFSINNDGELTVTYGGATNIDGTLRSDVDQDSVGTTIQFLKDGSLNIVDNNAQESILIDRPNGKVQIGASTEIDINAQLIQLGPNPTEAAVLGNQLVITLAQLCAQVQALSAQLSNMTVICPPNGGPSSPPVGATGLASIGTAVASIQSELNTILSEVVVLQ